MRHGLPVAKAIAFAAVAITAGALQGACGEPASAPADAEVTLEHCSYQDVPSTAGSGGTVAEAALQAGAAEAIIDVPVGTALGAYTARAGFLGTAGKVDLRRVDISGSFNPSIGVHEAPKVKVLALESGDERVVIVKLDLGLVYEGMTFDVEERLGPDYHGKVIISASHSHSAWGQQTGSFVFQIGLGRFRSLVYQRYLDSIEAVAKQAIAALRPARMGIASDFAFDLNHEITRDRRGENDELHGGPRKDSSMFMIRVDGVDDAPIAALPIYGVHGTIMGVENSFATSEATGAVERWLEEQFDSAVVVMHLQGAGGDVSPVGRGSLDCALKPGKEGDPCFDWLAIEGHGRMAVPALLSAYQAAGADMKSELEMEMLTRSIETGPYPETFDIRDGALGYADFEADRVADREIYDASGNILSPIDEFNAPVGASLCEADLSTPSTAYPLFPDGLIPGTDLLPPYGACVRIDAASTILATIMDLDAQSVDATHPVCQSTRTTVSALRLGDFVVGTVPGELTTMLAEQLRTKSPVAPEQTILLGYAQGHIGYCLTPEDWLLGGYEPSINIWGPLEGEFVGEKLVSLMDMVRTPVREDAGATGASRVATNEDPVQLSLDEPAPMAGTIPETVPEQVWLRTGPATSAQPSSEVPRVSGHASFVWIGDDPKSKTPVVTLEHESSAGVFETVRRRSGREVRTGELLLMYTPTPLRRVEGEPQTHYWAAEWQAVPWVGSQDGEVNLDGMDARAGVPLGRYRFRVVGLSFDIVSDVFTVTPAIIAVSAARSGTQISASVRLHDPRSYRLLDMTTASNTPVVIREGRFTVQLDVGGSEPLVFSDVQVSGEGTLTVDAGDQAAQVTSITVTDAFGNSGSETL